MSMAKVIESIEREAFENCMNTPEEDFLTENIKDNAEKIAEILYSGKDVEIRKNKTGISIAEISKKVVKR